MTIEEISRHYRSFASIARSYYFPFSHPHVTVAGTPSVIFLGNHSSGKSSLVNWILGDPPVQDTGVAPTDDGFTVIMFGEKEEDVEGPAAFTRLPDEFSCLKALGPRFHQHLRVKFRNRETLRRVNLVDSPGMIDSAGANSRRDYEFEVAVRQFARICDIVFFLFDPDKPGTTGETMDVFSKCLAGVEFKLRVLLNKCDAFTSAYDFARAYGTLCWNLSRVLDIKDLPKIYITYSGADRDRNSSGCELTDMRRHRDEVRSVFDNIDARRSDSVFAAADTDFGGLSIHMRVVGAAVRRIRRRIVLAILAGATAVLFAGGATALYAASAFGTDVTAPSLRAGAAWTLGAIAAATAGAVALLLGRWAVCRLRNGLADDAERIFRAEHSRQTVIGTPDNLSRRWDAVKDNTAKVIRKAPLGISLFIPFVHSCRLAAVSAAARKVIANDGRAG